MPERDFRQYERTLPLSSTRTAPANPPREAPRSPITVASDATACGTDRVIRVSTAVAVLAVAAVAAYVSYSHAYAVVRTYGENGITARLEPATIDGLVYASSMVILYAARHRLPVPALARWLLGLGVSATLTANMAQGWSHGPAGAAVAAWPAVSLVGSYELLSWLIRTAGTLEQVARQQRCGGTPCRALAGNPPAATAAEHGSHDSEAPDQAQHQARSAGFTATGAHTDRDDTAHPTDAVNGQAVAAYRLSVHAGNPLSERKLARMFGRTSRRWARARITQARQQSLPAAVWSSHLLPAAYRPAPQYAPWTGCRRAAQRC